MSTDQIRKNLELLEAHEAALSPVKLPFKTLEPYMSVRTVNIHYNVLTKGYFDKYNETGDPFAEAGAYLHNIWWMQLREPTPLNLPDGAAKDFIIDQFDHGTKLNPKARGGGLINLREEFKKAATSIQGNGWVALLKNGNIKQISNHKKVPNIVLLLDMWEHAYFLDYGANKEKYIDAFWKIVNWDVVGKRIS